MNTQTVKSFGNRRAATRSRKLPIMMNVLSQLSDVTPEHIRIVNIEFQKLCGSGSKIEQQMWEASGFQYRIHISGEIFNPFGDLQQILQNFVHSLSQQKIFKAIEVTDVDTESDACFLAFRITALL